MRAIDLYRGLKPIDVSEGMLALQRVGSHSTSLECMHRAADPKLPFEQRAQAITLTSKLMALHLRQTTALDQHRKNKLAEIAVPGWGEALFHEEMRDVETNPNFGAHGPLFHPRVRSPVVKSKPEPRAPSPPPTGRKSPPPSARKATF